MNSLRVVSSTGTTQGYNNPQVLNATETGTIRLRINDEAPYRWMTFEVSRDSPVVGACYAPTFVQLPDGKGICDVPIIELGDETPPIQQGLNMIAPLFGASLSGLQLVLLASRVPCTTAMQVGSTPDRSGATGTARSSDIKPININNAGPLSSGTINAATKEHAGRWTQYTIARPSNPGEWAVR